MTFLTPDLASVLGLGCPVPVGFDNVTGRGLGGIAGILLQAGNLPLQRIDLAVQK
jgi:hypothetical protein